MTAEQRSSLARLHERRRSPAWLFFRRFLAHPLRLASILESSPALSRIVAEQLSCDADDYVVELGAGTGPVTRALLAAGVSPDRLIAVEIDAQMAGFLRQSFPGVTVIEDDALDLRQVVPPEALKKIGAVICGVPISLLPAAQQRELVETSRANMGAQDQVHRAVSAMLEATSFEHLVHIVTRDLADILDVDVVTLCAEANGGTPLKASTGGVFVLQPGTIDALLGDGVRAVLDTDVAPDTAVFGPAAGLVLNRPCTRSVPSCNPSRPSRSA